MMPHLIPTWDPKDIVDKVRYLTQAMSDSSDSNNTAKSTTHFGLANEAVMSNRVKAVGNGAWIVLEVDGVTP